MVHGNSILATPENRECHLKVAYNMGLEPLSMIRFPEIALSMRYHRPTMPPNAMVTHGSRRHRDDDVIHERVTLHGQTLYMFV